MLEIREFDNERFFEIQYEGKYKCCLIETLKKVYN